MKNLLLICVFIFTLGAGLEEFVEDFHFAGIDKNGDRLYDIWAKTARVLEDVVNMNKLTAKVYGKNAVFIEAQKAVFYKNEDKIYLRDDVRILAQDKVLSTEELYWRPQKREAYTKKDVSIKDKGLSVKAKGLKQDLKVKRIELDKDIRLKIGEDAKFTYITCDGPMEIEYKENVAHLFNNVKVNDEKGDIYSDKMDIYFDVQTKKILKVHALGNVKIMRKDSTTYAQEAIYDFSTKRLTLKGSPRILIISEGQAFKDAGPKKPF